MKGAWILGFLSACATLALTTGSESRYTRETPRCLVYEYDTLENAMAMVHAFHSPIYGGQPGGNYNEGIVRYEPSDGHNGHSNADPVRATYKLAKRTRRSVDPKQQLKPLDMDFGDMTDVYDDYVENLNDDKKDDPSARSIMCTEHVNGTNVVLTLPPYLKTLVDLKEFFDKLFP